MLFFSKTKLDIHDSISIPNYTFISKARKLKVIRKSGGLGVFVKNEILPFVEELTTGEYVLWIKIAKSYANDDKDILLGCTYIPPISSRFYNDNEFELFEREVSLMASRFDLLYMCGEFNGQTAELDDLSYNDDFLNDMFDISGDAGNFLNQKRLLESSNIPIYIESLKTESVIIMITDC